VSTIIGQKRIRKKYFGVMSVWLSDRLARDRCGYLEHHKKNGIKIVLNLVEILRRISKLCFGVVLEVGL